MSFQKKQTTKSDEQRQWQLCVTIPSSERKLQYKGGNVMNALIMNHGSVCVISSNLKNLYTVHDISCFNQQNQSEELVYVFCFIVQVWSISF